MLKLDTLSLHAHCLVAICLVLKRLHACHMSLLLLPWKLRVAMYKDSHLSLIGSFMYSRNKAADIQMLCINYSSKHPDESHVHGTKRYWRFTKVFTLHVSAPDRFVYLE